MLGWIEYLEKNKLAIFEDYSEEWWEFLEVANVIIEKNFRGGESKYSVLIQHSDRDHEDEIVFEFTGETSKIGEFKRKEDACKYAVHMADCYEIEYYYHTTTTFPSEWSTVKMQYKDGILVTDFENKNIGTKI